MLTIFEKNLMKNRLWYDIFLTYWAQILYQNLDSFLTKSAEMQKQQTKQNDLHVFYN